MDARFFTIIIIAALLSSCRPEFRHYVIIGKCKNGSPSIWECAADSFTVVKNIASNERSMRCGILGSIGDTIAERYQ